MKNSKTGSRLTSTAYVLVTAAICIGMPVALLKIAGWPLPTSIPTFSDFSTSVQQQDIAAPVVIKALACILWLIWAQLVWSLVWEVIYVGPQLAKGMKAKSAPLSTSPTQRLAARLIGGIMSVGLITTSFASASDLPMEIAPIEAVNPDSFTAETVDETDGDEEQTADVNVWRVKPGDSLWSVSNGNESVMNEIFEANVSVNTALDVEIGMDLIVPNSLEVPEDRIVKHVKETTVVVEKGDHLWGIAESRLEQASPEEPTNTQILDYVDEVVEVNPMVGSNPDLIQPNDQFTFPEVGSSSSMAAAPKTSPKASVRSPKKESGTPGLDNTANGGERVGEKQGVGASLRLMLTSPRGIILGAGLFGLFLSLQHRQLVQGATHPLRRTRGPEEPNDLVRVSKLPLIEWAGKELSTVVDQIEDQPGSSGRPRLVEVRIEKGIDVVWQTPHTTAIEPWQVSAGGQLWTLEYKANAKVIRGNVLSAFPALVTLGSRTRTTDPQERRFRSNDSEDYDESLLVNLVDYGSLSLVGSEKHTRDVMRSMVLELGSSETLANAKIMLVDLEVEGVEQMKRVKVGEVNEAVAFLRGNAVTSQRQRIYESAVVFVSGDSPHMETLLDESTTGASAAVVVVGAAQNTNRHFVIQPNGADAFFLDNQADVIRPVSVTESQASEIAATFKALADEPEPGDWYVDVDDGSAQSKATSIVLQLGSNQRAVAATTPIMLTVFGQPQIPGLEATEAALAAVSYVLASPTRTVKDTDVIEAIWGSGTITVDDFWSGLENLRHTLSSDAILRSSNDELVVSPAVRTDLEVFASYVGQTSGLGPQDELVLLLEALKLVTGVPFSGSPLCHWAYRPDSPLALQAIELVEATAIRAAEIGVELSDYASADLALSHGLSGTGPNEPLLRMQMKVEAAKGNIEGVDAVFHGFSVTLAEEGWNQSALPSSETATLRNQLTANVP